MKYVFFVNPSSGKGNHENGIIRDIKELAARHPDKDISMVQTRAVMDAAEKADRLAGGTDDEITIFACGGDGTANEVANGIYGHDNAALGVVPVGSGNDFVRQLSKQESSTDDYTDLEKQLNGSAKKIDLIKMTWMEGPTEKSRFILNGVNIGFDGNTAILAHRLKKIPLVTGTGAYIAALIRNLIAKKGQTLHMTADGKEFYRGKLLLASAANGGYCGGGFNSCPKADISDGFMELLAIRDVTRRTFISLVPYYKSGEYFGLKQVDELVAYTRAKTVVIEPMLDGHMSYVGDGEIFDTGTIRLEVVPDAIKAVVL